MALAEARERRLLERQCSWPGRGSERSVSRSLRASHPPVDLLGNRRSACYHASCVWQARKFPEPQIVNEPGARCWYEQLSPDFERSKAFCVAVLRLRVRRHDRSTWLRDVQGRRPMTSGASASSARERRPVPQPAGGCISARRTPTPRSHECRPTAARSSSSP
jgi:hypothetical protein